MLAEIAADSSVPILLVNQGESPDVVRTYLDEQTIGSGDVVLDRGSGLSHALGIGGLPTTLFVDADGLVQRTHLGEISRAALLAELAALETR